MMFRRPISLMLFFAVRAFAASTFFLFILTAPQAGHGLRAQEPTEAEPNELSNRSESTGALPLPRFVSLRTNPVNLRIGPGVRYPVEWVYVRRNLPVEIIAEFETWRRIRDQDGTEGWVHQSMLSGRRTAAVKASGTTPLYKGDTDQSEMLAAVETGVVVAVRRCPAATSYCRVEIADHQGWIARAALWGLTPTEVID